MGEFFFWPQLPSIPVPVWFYTTDPAILVPAFSFVTAVVTVLLTVKALQWAVRDETMFPQFSREAQTARENALLDATILGLYDNVQGAPHAGDASLLFVGEAHAERLCQRCHNCALILPSEQCPDCDYIDPADRLSRGVA